MNRIYQGRVRDVQIANPDRNAPSDQHWLPFDPDPRQAKAKWQSAIWQHHQLFQDAVNYYTLALAAMASGVEGDSAPAKALSNWVNRVRESWQCVSRKAETFEGPQKRLASILRLPPGQDDFDTAVQRVLCTSRAQPAQRAAALMQLLAAKGDLNQVGVDRLPWLATAPGKLDATSKAAASCQQVKRQQIVRHFHQCSASEALEQAPGLDLGLFLTQPPTAWVRGAEATRILWGYFQKASLNYPELMPISAAFEEYIAQQEQLEIPAPGRKPCGLYPVTAIFKFFPRPVTLAVFRRATKTLADSRDREIVPDALAESRVEDQPHFDYFTNLALVNGGAGPGDRRAVWFEFDLAAFIEAIKAPRRFFEDMQLREETVKRLRWQIAAMEGTGHEAADAEHEPDTLPGFAGDPRIDRLRHLVRHKLAWLGEIDGETESSIPREYSLGEHTVRDFDSLKRRWRAAASAGQASEQHLLEIMAEEQARHDYDFGSATLYRELAKPENHTIWLDPGPQAWHAKNPLAAWLAYVELRWELAEKVRPIRFTPAHPVGSPRFFVFPKKNEAQPVVVRARSSKPGLLSRHDPGQLSFTAGIILRTPEGLKPTVARFHYTAPRLCRDQLRSEGDRNLYEAPWLQPMMSALGLNESPERINFANCRISLQPANEKDIQVAFPVEIRGGTLRAVVSQGRSWEKQYNVRPEGNGFYNTSLHWPSEKPANPAPAPWYQQWPGFNCLAAGFGQRDAGAFARLTVRDDRNISRKPSRFIGEAGGKSWHAALERSGSFRLPGEDAVIWRERPYADSHNSDPTSEPFAFREESWGHRGRPARDWETNETSELMQKLEATEVDAHGNLSFTVLPHDWRETLSFPEQNDKLLVALRRYQSSLDRLHRWCWFLRGDARQRETVLEEMEAGKDLRRTIPSSIHPDTSSGPRLLGELEIQLRRRLELAPPLLVRIANRILPLRGRSWQWEKHPAATESDPVYHLTPNGPSLDCPERPVWLRGQRGLSLERIAQLEELQKRIQSLQQATRRKIGDQPVMYRHESVPVPCAGLLEKLDNLKEQRINQTAHMILAEALGLRLAQPPADKRRLRRQQDQHGVYEKICNPSGQWIGPVDFIVIEEQSRYRGHQGRTPGENSRLQKWCHRTVREKLKQLCEVFGLPVLETPPAYGSRFCSRSSVPGFRAEEVTAGFTRTGPWAWLAGKKDEQGNPTDEARRLLDLDRQLTEAQQALEQVWWEKRVGPVCPKRTLFVPSSSGPVFIPVVDSCAGADISPAIVPAEINAAINLALQAIADPRLWTLHPRLRSQRGSGGKVGKKTKTEAQHPTAEVRLLTREKRRFGEAARPLVIHWSPETKPEDTRAPNFFADFAGLEVLVAKLAPEHQDRSRLIREWTAAQIAGENHTPVLLHGKTFWEALKAVQWARFEAINAARLAAWQAKLTRRRN